jgi:hypothetical protein
MNDLSILILYVIVFALNRSVSALLALLVWCAVAYTSYELSSEYPIDDVYLFPILSVVYAMCAVQMRKWRDSAWVGCVFVSLYYLYFSYDSWINWEVETWTYQNHESIVFAAHILVMLLLISVRLTVVSARLNLFWNNRCNSKTK